MSAALIEARVVARLAEAEDICRLQLQRIDGQPLPAYEAGAHVDLHLPGGLVRPYSLCDGGSAAPLHYTLAVLKVPASRGGSAAVHTQLQAGTVLHISAPRNLFALQAGATRHLLLAGGIGITPLLAMAWQLHQQGQAFELHYATRCAARTAFATQLQAAPFADRVHRYHDDAPADQQLSLARVLTAPAADPGAHLYLCGPQGFMDAVRGAARAAGWPDTRVHSESFGAALPVAAGAGADGRFEVQLGREGRIVVVDAGQSVCQALADAGVVIPTSCEQGVCGTCLTRVLDGEPEHRDQYLLPEEQAAHDQFTPCVSRARSPRLVLDL